MFRYARFLSAYALLAALACGGVAHAEPVQVVQAGDADLSCDAMTSQINALSADQAKSAKRAASGRKLLGFAGAALQVAGPLVSGGVGGSGGGAMGAMLAQQAMQQQMGGGLGVEAPHTDQGLEAQRLDRLNQLHAEKGC